MSADPDPPRRAADAVLSGALRCLSTRYEDNRLLVLILASAQRRDVYDR